MPDEIFPPVPSAVEIINFNFTEPGPNFYVHAHIHHFHQLDIILHGSVETEIEGQHRHVGTAGTAWLIPPLMRHQFNSQLGYRQCSFKMRLAARYWPAFGAKFRNFTISPSLLQAIESAGARHLRRAPLANLQVSAIAALSLVECFDQIGSELEASDNLDSFRQTLWPLLESIENDPQGAWSVKIMSAQCHMSVDHFSRCFQRVLRQSPQHYLLEVRLRASAAELVMDPERPIKEIADRSGYANVPAFTRAFKRMFDSAPAAYRSFHISGLQERQA